MSAINDIITSTINTTNTWRPIAIVWHVYFAIIAILLLAGLRPSKRITGILFALPFISVCIIAFLSLNSFNGITFALISILVIVVSMRLPSEKIRIAPVWILVPGIVMFLFGWVYPDFLDASNSWSFLYSSPAGLIPCPTLSLVIGLALILNGLESRNLTLILGIYGFCYGITGAAIVGVTVDWVLFLGSIVILILAVVGKHRVWKKKDPIPDTQSQM
jgi:hypothetical protein